MNGSFILQCPATEPLSPNLSLLPLSTPSPITPSLPDWFILVICQLLPWEPTVIWWRINK